MKLMLILATVLYIFSADGLKPASGERSCPMQGVDLQTGEIVIGLPAQDGPTRARCGWYELGERPDNFVVTNYVFDASTGMATRQGYIRPPRKRTVNYSKLKIYGALSSIGKWDAFEEWLKSEELAGMNAWTAFSLAQELSADDERFDHYCQRACEALGITEEQKTALLEACEL